MVTLWSCHTLILKDTSPGCCFSAGAALVFLFIVTIADVLTAMGCDAVFADAF